MQKSYRAPDPGENRAWFIIDAKDRSLGRLAVVIANKLRAKERWLRTRAFTDEAHGDDHCSMCGKQFCAVRTSRRIRELAERRCAGQTD